MNPDLQAAHIGKAWGHCYTKICPGQMCDRAMPLKSVKLPSADEMAYKASKAIRMDWPLWGWCSGLLLHLERNIDELEHIWRMTNVRNMCSEEKVWKNIYSDFFIDDL